MDNFSDCLDFVILTGNDKMMSKLKNEINIKTPIIERSLNMSDIKNSEKEDYLKNIFGARIYIL